ncbi:MULTISPECIES: TetR/AcrR family transcriptional regulator [unclassified Nonomuraea]|uniref:TetR/AcrR family transcriptional regulator n=1 Tax=unclassified Nonomuraea TaxID=2593643 RepID=UPI0034035576
MVTTTKPERGGETRELLVTTAERLFAEHGVAAVSNRQVSEAAGQANNSAVGYHIGTKTDLVLAIVRRHAEPMERRRAEMLTTITDSAGLHEWIACLVRPVTEHIADLGTPTWYARFAAQVTTDPAFRKLVTDETITSSSLRQTLDGISRLVPDLPEQVRQERKDMIRHLLVHMCAERERALHEGTATPHATWDAAATGMIDAITGLWLAPVSATP